MKYSLVIFLLVFLSSATQAEQYRWDYMDIGVSNDGLGKGMIFSVASHTVGNFFARANLMRNQHKTETKPISSLYSFYTLGYQYRIIYAEVGLSQYDICWYACMGYSGDMALIGLAGGSGKLRAKLGTGRLNLMEQQWLIVEAEASYTFNDNLGISLGITDLDELGGKVTKLGIRLSW
ncbi:hypothetical protein N9I42_01235 [Porticoccaceae bacterium]|nr:hypothetical protein [Porticoccaceae bacterium]